MTKYSEIEIETAKNLLEHGYKWIARNKSGKLVAHAAKPSKVSTYWWSGKFSDYTCDYVPIFQSVTWDDKAPVSLESIVNPPILDDAEKRYLKVVIRPFRDKVAFICKVNCLDGFGFQRIAIGLNDISEDIALPLFKGGTMYKGMELGHGYKLEELGL